MNISTPLTDLQGQICKDARAAGRPVRGLLSWLLDRRNLEAAWERVHGADGANTPGLDGATCADIERRPSPWLARLGDDLLHGRYVPSAPRWVDVPKHPGSTDTRRLGILTIRDRVVHAALKQVLEPVLDPIFLPSSFGFRPGRSVPGALAEALRRLAGQSAEHLPLAWAAHLDVADCFDTVDHVLLRQELGQHVGDPGLLALLDRVLEAGGTTRGRWWWKRRVRLVQGSALSPLLCNLYLHSVDVRLAELALATQGGIQVLRYADDLLLLAANARLARQGAARLRELVAERNQRLRAGAEVAPIQEGVEWLGVRIQPRRNPWAGPVRFGYVIPDSRVGRMLERVVEMTVPPSSRIDAGAFNLGRWLVSINDQLREWHQAYVYADNTQEVFRVIDDQTRRRVGELLHAVTGKRRNDLFAAYRLWLPRGFWTWQVDGCRLMLLSALAPRCPRGLTRPPDWMRPGSGKFGAGPCRFGSTAAPAPEQGREGRAEEIVGRLPAPPSANGVATADHPAAGNT